MPAPALPRAVRFLLNGSETSVSGLDPTTTLLQVLRERLHCTGTKEGCAEGDCGACAVVVADLNAGGTLGYRSVNSCIRFAGSVDGKAVFTVEGLRDHPPGAAVDSGLHPVQQAIVECHGSQCGFCTPGFVMSLFALYKQGAPSDRQVIDDALSGNLCRCTGYRPIVEAAARALADRRSLPGWRGRHPPGTDPDEGRIAALLAHWRAEPSLALASPRGSFHAPRSLAELTDLIARMPEARLVAGGTDVGLWVTKQHRDLGDVIHTGEVAELRVAARTSDTITIGAAVTLTEAFALLAHDYPELDEAWRRFGSVPIRNSGTLGGNVANGSPIGDSMPVLLALGASVELAGRDGRRVLPLADFYTGYQTSVRLPGEVLVAIRTPRRVPGLIVRAYKVSRRHDQDISAVFACFALELAGETVRSFSIGVGGMAAVPRRAIRTEAFLRGRPWNETTVRAAIEVLASEFLPLDDWRASAAYRSRVLGNLLRRFLLESQAPEVATRVLAATVQE